MLPVLLQIDLQHYHVLLRANTAASTAADTSPTSHTHLYRITNPGGLSCPYGVAGLACLIARVSSPQNVQGCEADGEWKADTCCSSFSSWMLTAADAGPTCIAGG